MTKEIKKAIETLHECKAEYVDTISVEESHAGQTVWVGDVHLYEVEHADASECFAWAEENDSKTRYFAVLKQGRIKTASDAVRASILADLQGGT